MVSDREAIGEKLLVRNAIQVRTGQNQLLKVRQKES